MGKGGKASSAVGLDGQKKGAVPKIVITSHEQCKEAAQRLIEIHRVAKRIKESAPPEAAGPIRKSLEEAISAYMAQNSVSEVTGIGENANMRLKLSERKRVPSLKPQDYFKICQQVKRPEVTNEQLTKIFDDALDALEPSVSTKVQVKEIKRSGPRSGTVL